MGVILIIFQKKIVWGKWTILGPKMGHPYNSGSDVRIFLNFVQWKGPVGLGFGLGLRFLNSEDMISQVNIYVMDIVWILCDVYVWSSRIMVL